MGKSRRDKNIFTQFDKLLGEAYDQSQKAPMFFTHRHGAVLVSRSGAVLARGYNNISLNGDVRQVEQLLNRKEESEEGKIGRKGRKERTNRLSFDKKSTIHAEVDCFLKMGFDQRTIKGSTLIIYGESRAGNVVKSRPCVNCMKLARFLRVRRVVYSSTRGTQVVEQVEY